MTRPSSETWRQAGPIVLLLALFVATAWLCRGDVLYRWDEIGFVKPLVAWRATGDLRYWSGNGLGQVWPLWHPPLYLALLWGWSGLLGASEVALRMLGVVLAAAAGLFVYLTGTTLGGRRLGLTGAGLLLLSPLAVRSALLVDYPGLAMLTVALFMWAAVRGGEPRTVRQVAVLAGLVALMSWANLGPVVPVGVACGVWWWRARGWRYALGVVATVFGLGVAAFLLTWLAVSSACHLPFALPFLHGLHAGGQAPARWGNGWGRRSGSPGRSTPSSCS